MEQKKVYCVKCKKEHVSDWGWIYKDWGNNKVGWGCKKGRTKHLNIFTPEHVLKQREKYKDDLIQPFREGELSREFANKYPKRVEKMIEGGQIKRSEVENAKNVWK